MQYSLYFLNGKAQSTFEIDYPTKQIKFITPKKETTLYVDTMKEMMNAENNIILMQSLFNYGYEKQEIYNMIGLGEKPSLLQFLNHPYKTIKGELKKFLGFRSEYLLGLV